MYSRAGSDPRTDQKRGGAKPVVENPGGGGGWACTRKGAQGRVHDQAAPPRAADHWLN